MEYGYDERRFEVYAWTLIVTDYSVITRINVLIMCLA